MYRRVYRALIRLNFVGDDDDNLKYIPLSATARNSPGMTNIVIDYTPSWGIKEGLRELIQNWRDGMLEAFWPLKMADIQIKTPRPIRNAKKTHFEFSAYNGASDSTEPLGTISYTSTRTNPALSRRVSNRQQICCFGSQAFAPGSK